MNTVEIGKFIKEHLKVKGYTQDDLATYLGISKQAVSQNLNGKSTFELSNIMMIAEYLDVTVDDILYAGEKRETLLSKFFYQNIEKININNSPEQPDSQGKTLLDYCIEDNNIDKFQFFYSNKLITDTLYNNTKFIAFLVRKEALALLQSYWSTPLKDENGMIVSFSSHKLEFPSLQVKGFYFDYSRAIPLYANLSESEKVYVDAVLNCKNESILNLIPDLSVNRLGRGVTSKLLIIAIEKDVPNILRYYISQNHISVNQDLFSICIIYKSSECAKYLYDNYELKSVENLLKIGDRDYVKERLSSMKLNQYQMSKGIIDAVKANDLMAVRALINIVDKNALNLALEEVDFTKSIEIAKALLDAGAVFNIINAYDSSHRIELPSVTSAIKFLLEKQDDK